MKLIILASSNKGTASHHLPYLLLSTVCEISMVILSKGSALNRQEYYRRKIRKMLKIGLFGALNGIRMRKWYQKDIKKYIEIGSLEEICFKMNIPFYYTPAINCDVTKQLFHQARADVGISLGNGYIGKNIFSIPKYGMLNVHHEILPQYKNAQSIIWQIYNGSINTGYTIHKIDQHIDTGEILFEKTVPILFKNTLSDSVACTSAVLLKESANGLIYVIENFDFLFTAAKPQSGGKSYTTPSFMQFLKIQYNFWKLRKIFKVK